MNMKEGCELKYRRSFQRCVFTSKCRDEMYLPDCQGDSLNQNVF